MPLLLDVRTGKVELNEHVGECCAHVCFTSSISSTGIGGGGGTNKHRVHAGSSATGSAIISTASRKRQRKVITTHRICSSHRLRAGPFRVRGSSLRLDPEVEIARVGGERAGRCVRCASAVSTVIGVIFLITVVNSNIA